jgi:hypothetical protein
VSGALVFSEKEVTAAVGFSRVTLWREELAGRFPRRRQLRSSTNRSPPIRATSDLNRSQSRCPSRKTHEVTMTCEAPASR